MVNRAHLAVQKDTLEVRTFNEAMARVYLWMVGGLATTAIVALAVAQSESIAAAVFGRPFVYMGLFAAQIILVMTLSAGINKLAPFTALGLFFLYSGLTGVTLALVFLVYDLGTVGVAFGATAATFTAMSMVGLTTKKDLTGWGPVAMASLFGLIIALVVNSILQSNALEWAVSVAGVLIFMGLTVYDSKLIRYLTDEAVAGGDTLAASRVGLLGALSLYLDFLNMFLFLLSMLGEDNG